MQGHDSWNGCWTILPVIHVRNGDHVLVITLLIGGMLLSTFVAAYWWSKSFYLKCFPIIYGVSAGIVYAFFIEGSSEISRILEIVLVSAAIGVVAHLASGSN